MISNKRFIYFYIVGLFEWIIDDTCLVPCVIINDDIDIGLPLMVFQIIIRDKHV